MILRHIILYGCVFVSFIAFCRWITPSEVDSLSPFSPKPVSHLVLMSLREDPAAIAQISELLRRCKTLPGVITLHFGRHNPTPYNGYTDRSDGYNYGVHGTYKDWASLEKYGTHPWHVEAVLLVRSLELKKSIKLDFVEN
eukprot:PhF_6_TR19848/c0_g1_i1/m.28938